MREDERVLWVCWREWYMCVWDRYRENIECYGVGKVREMWVVTGRGWKIRIGIERGG